MRHASVRSLVVLVLLVGVTACGDARLKKLSLGIDRDSVAVLMGTDQPDRSAGYLLDGKFLEVFYYAPRGKSLSDSAGVREYSPVILADGSVVGWGWDYWGREADRLKVDLTQ
ncbi:MAG TPA: DUF3192 domain-containing protein [Gemmatimonadales bacterium]|nr:DUF3192 domain-containing protein [Gemmatimonadales bacterium]